MIFAQAHHDESGHGPGLEEGVILFQENVGIVGVSHPARLSFFGYAKVRTHVADKSRYPTLHFDRSLPVTDPPTVLSIAPIGNTCSFACVPQVPARSLLQIALVVVVYPLSTGIGQVPVAG